MHAKASAESLARSHLAEALPRRWSHVQAVARRAEQVGHTLKADRSVLRDAAWLHDIGYAPTIVDSGFHPLDGARYLRGIGIDDRVVRLVAHHSCAALEAEERGLASTLLEEFEREDSVTADLLWFCDMTTGPDGRQMTVASRLIEIEERYGPEHLVTRFVARARPQLVAAVERAEAFLDDAQPRYGWSAASR